MRRATALLLSAVALAAPAAAQTAEDRPVHRVEASAGALWLGGASLGSATATLRANQTSPSPFVLFRTTTRASSAGGVDAAVGYWLTRSLVVEGGFAYTRPSLRSTITADAEGAPTLTAEEQIHQYFVEGSVSWLLDRWRLTSNTVPFVSAGAGYLRQLHEGRTLVETGQVYHVGGGVRHWLRVRDTGWIRGLGLRVDGRARFLVNGVRLESGPRTHGAISGSLFVTF